MERGEVALRGEERLRIREADARHDVPVVPGQALELERRARGDDVQSALGVERVTEREQVEVVRPAPMVEEEQARGWSSSAGRSW